jgi:aryl-alcohol dehydrogenase-like predicted oxidoreductase
MHCKKLGSTGLAVSTLCLGTNTFGGADDKFWRTLGGLNQSAVNEIVSSAIGAGINFLDTADVYSAGESEERVGCAIQQLKIKRDDVVIATKMGGRVGPGPNAVGASRSHILRAVEASLHRLKLEYLDLCMVHFFDPATPLEETLRALDRLVQDGKVRYIGCSNFSAWETMKALAISRHERLARFDVIECHWSIATRELEREVVPLVLDQQLGLMIWGPLLGGLLTGKIAADGAAPVEGRTKGQVPPVLNRARLLEAVEALRRVATPRNVPLSQIALAWLLHQPAVTSVLFGARSVQQLAENVDAAEIHLTSEEMRLLNEATAMTPDYGSWLVRNARADRTKLLT